MASVIDHYGDNQDVIIANAGPGHWNDPDMVGTIYFIFCLSFVCLFPRTPYCFSSILNEY